MLNAYRSGTADWNDGERLSETLIWVDLIDPTDTEKRVVKRVLEIRILDEANRQCYMSVIHKAQMRWS